MSFHLFRENKMIVLEPLLVCIKLTQKPNQLVSKVLKIFTAFDFPGCQRYTDESNINGKWVGGRIGLHSGALTESHPNVVFYIMEILLLYDMKYKI